VLEGNVRDWSRSGGKVCVLQELVDGGGEGVEGGAQGEVRRWGGRERLGQTGTEHPQVDPAAEERDAQTLVGGLVAPGAGRTRDQAVQP